MIPSSESEWALFGQGIVLGSLFMGLVWAVCRVDRVAGEAVEEHETDRMNDDLQWPQEMH